MRGRRLDALLLLDKPRGVTSNGALQQARRLYRAAKAGHAGTLDPLASGLLPILFGESTKFAGLLLDSEKEYDAWVRLGVATTTGDAEGEVIERRPVQVDAARLEQALGQLRGTIAQVPPMYSALKQGGRPLYALARSGVEVERAPRRVVVSVLELLERREAELRLRIRCSKGTYVRTLATDLGVALGTGAHLVALRRTAAGRFSVADATSSEALATLDDAARERLLLPLQALFEALPAVVLEAPAAARFACGAAVAASAAPGRCQVLDSAGRLLGLGEAAAGGALRPVRLLAEAAQAGARSGKTL